MRVYFLELVGEFNFLLLVHSKSQLYSIQSDSYICSYAGWCSVRGMAYCTF